MAAGAPKPSYFEPFGGEISGELDMHAHGHRRTPTVITVLLSILLTACTPTTPGPGGGTPRASPGTPGPTSMPSAATTLVLYDTTGPYGALGELYAVQAANLVAHFGAWKALPVARYTAGDAARHTLTIYIGSTYDEP